MYKIIVDSEISLHSLQSDSSSIIFQKISDSLDFLQEWLPWVEELQSVDDLKERMDKLMEKNPFKENIMFEIWFKEDFAGIISLKDYDKPNRKSDLGYWLTKEYLGKGIIIRSMATLIQHAFTDLDINKLQIKCSIGNIKSCNIPKQLNFTYEGIEREGEFINNKFVDLKVYSLLKKEWKKSHAANK